MRREVISRSRNYVTGTITVTVLESDDRGTRWRVKGAEQIECGRPIQVGDPVTIVVGSDRYAAVITWVSATLSSVVVSHVNDIDGTNVNVGGFGFRAIGNVTQIAREEGMFTRRRDGTYREKSKGRSVKYLIIGISESYRDLSF